VTRAGTFQLYRFHHYTSDEAAESEQQSDGLACLSVQSSRLHVSSIDKDDRDIAELGGRLYEKRAMKKPQQGCRIITTHDRR